MALTIGGQTSILAPPVARHNPTAGVATYSTLQLQPGQFALHPGPGNQYEKARLTISSPGIYAISGNFAGADVQGTTTDVHILFNGISIFDGSVNGFGSGTGPSFSFTKTLAANDALDFAVGFGSNGNFFNDTTALAAQISAVPEASSASMFGIGGALLAALVFLRRKTESCRA